MKITATGARDEFEALHEELNEHGIELDGDAFITSTVTNENGTDLVLEIHYSEIAEGRI